jgi:long-chain acyl-CoA synthetase
MESAILLDPLFEQVMIVGESKAFLAALLVLDAERWPLFAASLGLDPAAPATLRNPKLLKALIVQMASHLKAFPGYAQIRRVCPTLTPWTVEDGLLTPTLKIKRNRVASRYRSAIDSLYADHDR